MKLVLEDDSHQLKVADDEVPPVRQPETAATVESPTGPGQNVLGADARTLDPKLGQRPTGIPGLALRVAATKKP